MYTIHPYAQEQQLSPQFELGGKNKGYSTEMTYGLSADPAASYIHPISHANTVGDSDANTLQNNPVSLEDDIFFEISDRVNNNMYDLDEDEDEDRGSRRAGTGVSRAGEGSDALGVDEGRRGPRGFAPELLTSVLEGSFEGRTNGALEHGLSVKLPTPSQASQRSSGGLGGLTHVGAPAEASNLSTPGPLGVTPPPSELGRTTPDRLGSQPRQPPGVEPTAVGLAAPQQQHLPQPQATMEPGAAHRTPPPKYTSASGAGVYGGRGLTAAGLGSLPPAPFSGGRRFQVGLPIGAGRGGVPHAVQGIDAQGRPVQLVYVLPQASPQWAAYAALQEQQQQTATAAAGGGFHVVEVTMPMSDGSTMMQSVRVPAAYAATPQGIQQYINYLFQQQQQQFAMINGQPYRLANAAAPTAERATGSGVYASMPPPGTLVPLPQPYLVPQPQQQAFVFYNGGGQPQLYP